MWFLVDVWRDQPAPFQLEDDMALNEHEAMVLHCGHLAPSPPIRTITTSLQCCGAENSGSLVMHVGCYGCNMDFTGQARCGFSPRLRCRLFSQFRAAVARRTCTLSIVRGSQHCREIVRRSGWFRRGMRGPSSSQFSLQVSVLFSVTPMANLRCSLAIVAKVSCGSLQS